MKKNIGKADRLIRIAIAVILAAVIFTQPIVGGLGITLSIIGGYALLTGVAGDCPVYWLFGVSTCEMKHAKGVH